MRPALLRFDSMAWVMFQFRNPGAPPTVAQVCERFGFLPAEIDPDYGLVLVDEREGLYVALVDERSRTRVEARLPRGDSATGYFADPPVEPFTPPSA